MTRQFKYESDWRQHAFPRQSVGFTRREELERRYTPVTLERSVRLQKGGMPLWSDGRNAVVNTENEHSIIFGGTASKKTRTLIVPLIQILAQAGESMVIMDIKGELSNGTSFRQIDRALKAGGYQCRFLDLRTRAQDGLNILTEPYRLYRAGEKDDALAMCSDIVDTMASIYKDTKVDPFWEMTARQYLTAVMALVFELCDDEKAVNLLTLASFNDSDSCDVLGKVANLIESDGYVMTLLRNVLSEPEKTRMSTLATVSSMFSRYMSNERLLKMLSNNTVDLHSLGIRRTALFIILPDEVDTYGPVAGLLLNQISTTLVRDALKAGGSLYNRVNFICDEFCNYYVPGMMRAISAHRSRNIRWYLVCQSLKQLSAAYPDEADTILANCANTFFLSSPELELLEYLSRRSGFVTETESGQPEPLISVAQLQSMRKGWTHTDVYFTAGSTHFFSRMPDTSLYDLHGDSGVQMTHPVADYGKLPVFTARHMLARVRYMATCAKNEKNKAELEPAEKALAKRFQNLFQ